MRIAVISDIHGNLESLSALTDSYDELWVLGDLVNYGPDPGGVVDFVRSHATLVVRGNHDHAVAFNEDPRCSPPYREMAKETMQFTRSVLSRDQIEYLASLPLMVERTVQGSRFVLCHAAPSDPLYRYVPANSQQWREEMKLVSTDVLLVGHTHTPFLQSVGQSQVVNPGSLGQPKTGSIRACYATWENGAVLQSCRYDLPATLSKIDKMPVSSQVKEDLKAVLVSGGRSTSSALLLRD
jgi:putative phosphoesterase